MAIIDYLVKSLLIPRDRIKAQYQKCWLYRVPPHYRRFYPYGFEGETTPTDFRLFLRIFPYFVGSTLDLELKIKPKLPSTSSIDKLEYEWGLFCGPEKEPREEGTGEFHNNLFEYGTLVSSISTKPLSTIAQYQLKIKIYTDGNNPTLLKVLNSNVLLKWDTVCVFELHSEDKPWFALFLSIGSFVLGMVALYLIQAIFHIKLI